MATSSLKDVDIASVKQILLINCFCYNQQIHNYTGLFQMIGGVLTTCHTQYTSDSSICFFSVTEQHSKFLLHTLQVLYMCTLCDCTNINMIITADMLQTVWNELDYRVDVCRITKGAHIEHL